MRLQTVPAGRGAHWVRQGFAAFFRRPLAFAALFGMSLFAMFVFVLVPLIGPLLVSALLPLLSLLFMIATRAAVDGTGSAMRAASQALRRDRSRSAALLKLGLAYAVATFAIIWFSDVADGGAFEALIDTLPSGQSSADALELKLAAPGLFTGMTLRFGLAALLSVPFWHAPALVYWDSQGCAQSLFSSTLACWRNRGAFLVYSLVWFALIVVVGMVASVLFALLGAAALFSVAALPLSLILMTVFYVSLYFTFADCFVAAESPVAPSPHTLTET